MNWKFDFSPLTSDLFWPESNPSVYLLPPALIRHSRPHDLSVARQTHMVGGACVGMGRSLGVVQNYCRKLLLRCSPNVWRTHIER